jgi:hypothetical protein
MENLFWFIGLQFVNVLLNTIRSITTIRSKAWIASIISAITYTFYYVVVKIITSQDLLTIGIVTFVTNIIGVWLGKIIMTKITPDSLWVYGVTYKDDIKHLTTITKILDEMKIGYILNDNTPTKTLQIFSYSQKDSRIIVDLLNRYKVKFYAVESKETKN